MQETNCLAINAYFIESVFTIDAGMPAKKYLGAIPISATPNH